MWLLNRVDHSYLFIEFSYGIRFFRLCFLGNRLWDGDLPAEALLRNNTCNGAREARLGGQRDRTDAVATETLVSPFGNSGAWMTLQSCLELDVGWPDGVTLGGVVSFCGRDGTTQFSFPVAEGALSRWLSTVSWFRVCLSYRELLHLRSQSSRGSLQMAEQGAGIKV